MASHWDAFVEGCREFKVFFCQDRLGHGTQAGTCADGREYFFIILLSKSVTLRLRLFHL